MGRWAWGSSSIWSSAALCESSRAIRVGKRKKKKPIYIAPVVGSSSDLDDAFLLLKTFFFASGGLWNSKGGGYSVRMFMKS